MCSFVAKSVVFVIYAVLLHGRFCQDLPIFAWRKIEPKIVPVEKKGQISGMPCRIYIVDDRC